ncbi:MAG TPA: response regulator [Oscillatoriaceae cyanobacterium]
MRVLIVDDDPNCRQIVELMLAHFGWKIVTAENGAEGLRSVSAEPADLVLMDILMPEMSGLEAVGRMKDLPGMHDVPIIALTALAFAEEREAAIAAGYDSVITKPFGRKQLLAGIERHFPGLTSGDPNKVPA